MTVKLVPMRANLTEIEVGPGLDLLFSYRTIVAFRTNVMGWRISAEQHSVTTSKHLNERFGKPFRTEHTIPTAQFDLELTLVMNRLADAMAGITFPEPQEDPT